MILQWTGSLNALEIRALDRLKSNRKLDLEIVKFYFSFVFQNNFIWKILVEVIGRYWSNRLLIRN